MQVPEPEWWQELVAHDAPFLREKLLSDGIFASEEAFESAFLEWKKYMALTKWEGPLAMTSKDVDAVWHQYILFTRQYRDFCDAFFGHFVHHAPATPSEPLAQGSRQRFQDAYEHMFGLLHSIWTGSSDCKSDCGCEKGKCSG